jgi:two-component system, cell cycle sensor histidine kinase and response regulator CckA
MFTGKVLVVDDEQSVRELFARVLANLSYEVYSAASAMQGLEILQAVPIEVIVTDLRMPEIDGIELIRLVQETDPVIQSIVVSGCMDKKTHSRALEAGAFTCFEKPVDITRLGTAIKQAMARRVMLLNSSAEHNS